MESQEQKLLSIIKGGKFSDEGYNSCNKAFFRQEPSDHNHDGDKKTLHYFDKFQHLGIVGEFYQLLGEPDREWYSQTNLTFISWNKALDFYNRLEELGQHDIFDFAFKYRGMGHIRIYFVCLSSGRIYSRSEGGSNDYDRLDNQNRTVRWTEPQDDSSLYFWSLFDT